MNATRNRIKCSTYQHPEATTYCNIVFFRIRHKFSYKIINFAPVLAFNK